MPPTVALKKRKKEKKTEHLTSHARCLISCPLQR